MFMSTKTATAILGGDSWQSAKAGDEWSKTDCFNAGFAAGIIDPALYALCGILL